MKCPACGRELSQVVAGDVTIDACKEGCGGLWFDQLELRRFDEPSETAGEVLLDIHRKEGVQIDQGPRRKCPKCKTVPMMRHFFSVKRQVQVDECPKCGGYWLDPGELATIRSQYASEQDRTQAAEKVFSDLFGGELRTMAAESDEKLQKARKISSMFRFLCPSYYIPGKQDWGAF
jgi:Zn-finger nucleic acid-binding protein